LSLTVAPAKRWSNADSYATRGIKSPDMSSLSNFMHIDIVVWNDPNGVIVDGIDRAPLMRCVMSHSGRREGC
jgi:hypothetical protein